MLYILYVTVNSTCLPYHQFNSRLYGGITVRVLHVTPGGVSLDYLLFCRKTNYALIVYIKTKYTKLNYYETNISVIFVLPSGICLLSNDPRTKFIFMYYKLPTNSKRRTFKGALRLYNSNRNLVISNNLKSTLGIRYFSNTGIKLYNYTPRGSGNNYTKYLTIKRIIPAFISLIICAYIKFGLFPIITPYLLEVPEIYNYLILGVLFIPIRLAVMGVVDDVHSIFIPETMDTGGGSNPPSLEKAGVVKSHNTQTGVKKGVLIEHFPQYLAMNSGGSNRPSSPTGPSQHSQYPPQTGAGRSPQTGAGQSPPRPRF